MFLKTFSTVHLLTILGLVSIVCDAKAIRRGRQYGGGFSDRSGTENVLQAGQLTTAQFEAVTEVGFP